MFMRRTTQWPAGGAVRAVDLPVTSPVREAFSREIHGRSALAIDAFWTKQIFSGTALPPQVLQSERDVLEFVRQNADAIGYVSAEQPLGSGVKALDVVAAR